MANEPLRTGMQSLSINPPLIVAYVALTAGIVIASVYLPHTIILWILAAMSFAWAKRKKALSPVSTSVSPVAEADDEPPTTHQARLMMIGEMTASIAHDLKNPISVVDIFLQLLQAELERQKVMTPEIEEKLTRIFHAKTKLNKLVQMMNRFTRDDVALISGNSIDEVIENTRIMVEHRLKTSSVELKVHAPQEPKSFYGCANEIEQVLINLVNNAIDALEGLPGERQIDITVEEAGPSFEFVVRDNGPGVPDQLKKELFKPFFTTKGSGKGTGLGLHICRSIIHHHGGQLTLLPTQTGAAFAFFLRREPHQDTTAVV